jgi:hypothetical protein
MITGSPGEADARAQTLAAILRYTPDEADCLLCQKQLDIYIEAQLGHTADQTSFAWTAQHLDSCLACAEVYALLYEVVMADENGRLPQPAQLPEPDLTFLESSPDWLAALKAALTVSPAQLALQFNAALVRLLAPAPTLALSRSLTNGRYQPKLLEITLEQAQTLSLPFTLAAYADQQQPNHCLVEITVQPAGQSWPDLGGYQVTLKSGGQTFTGETDDWGTAVFPDILLIELEDLHLRVQFGTQT